MEDTLGALVEQYKKEPSGKLRRAIWNSVLSEELADVLKTVKITPESDWICFVDRVYTKRVVDRKYLVAEMYRKDNALFGFCYLINLNDYTESEIRNYKGNCPEYAMHTSDPEFHAAVAVGITCSAKDAKATCIVDTDYEFKIWLDRLESEIRI